MKILGTGLDGLVGSRIVELLKDQYEFESSVVDITDRNSIITRIRNSDASIVLHLAAKTSVDGCEEDREIDTKILRYENNERREGQWLIKKTAWGVNVFGTQNIAEACQESKKRLIYISTDFVFDGFRPPVGGYEEEDIPSPINWYGKTKHEGEKIVKNASIPWAIARIAYPYRASFARNDFARAILKRLQDQKPVAAVTDHIFTPTFIDDIAFALGALIKSNSRGIFHAVGSESLTPYDAAILIAKHFNLDQKLIVKTTRAEFFKNRAPRPFHLALKNDKIRGLGVRMRGFEEGLRELKSQMSNLKSTSQI